MPGGGRSHFARALPFRKVPKHMHRHGRTASRIKVRLSRVGKLIRRVDGCRILKKLSETGSGVRVAPARGFDREIIKTGGNFRHVAVGEVFVHKGSAKLVSNSTLAWRVPIQASINPFRTA